MSQILIEYQVCKTNDKFGISIALNNHERYFNSKVLFVTMLKIYTLTLPKGGLLKPPLPPEWKWQRQHFFMVQLCWKNWLFSETNGKPSHTLLGAWNGKKGFPKLIAPNDCQQFWFLSLFQISDVKFESV